MLFRFGAGVHCDGQVLTIHDMLALPVDHGMKHNKVYANLGDLARTAIGQYAAEVRDRSFPTDANSFPMDPAELAALEAELGLTPQRG